jgi:hypothetical protein
LITTEENLINIADAHAYELIDIGKSLSDAAQDRARRDEKELADTLNELKHLRRVRVINSIVKLSSAMF